MKNVVFNMEISIIICKHLKKENQSQIICKNIDRQLNTDFFLQKWNK